VVFDLASAAAIIDSHRRTDLRNSRQLEGLPFELLFDCAMDEEGERGGEEMGAGSEVRGS
jgi:hypothetical protein